MPDNGTTTAAALPRQCGDCGYRLDMLPREGRCPECGRDYRADQFVLFGWAGQTKATFANSRASRTAGFAVLWAAVLAAVALLFMSHMRRAPAMVWVIAGAAAVYSSYHYRGLRAAGTPPVQLRLSPQGVAQFDGVGMPECFERWEGRWRVSVASSGGPRHRSSWKNCRPSGWRCRRGPWTLNSTPARARRRRCDT